MVKNSNSSKKLINRPLVPVNNNDDELICNICNCVNCTGPRCSKSGY